MAYDEATTSLKFDPFTSNQVLREGTWDTTNIDTDGDGTNDLDLTGSVKISFLDYVKILNRKYPFIATDFEYNPYWDFWTPETSFWDFDNLPSSVTNTDNGWMVMTVQGWLLKIGVLYDVLEPLPPAGFD